MLIVPLAGVLDVVGPVKEPAGSGNVRPATVRGLFCDIAKFVPVIGNATDVTVAVRLNAYFVRIQGNVISVWMELSGSAYCGLKQSIFFGITVFGIKGLAYNRFLKGGSLKVTLR